MSYEYIHIMADKQIAFGLSPPENAVAHGLQEGEHSEEKLYSIIAISDQFGEIPGNTATVEKS